MLRALLILVLGSTLAACVVTPLVYSLLISLLDEVPWPYSRVFDRVALVMLIVLGYRLRKDLRLATLWPYYRDWRARGEFRRLWGGALLSTSTAMLAMPFVVLSGWLIWHPHRTTGELLLIALGVIPAAIVISVIEESFFRVLVFGKLREVAPTFLAALASSLFYAVLHFVSPDKSFEYTGWSPTIGFEYFGAVLERFSQPGVSFGIVGLTLVGLVLCFALRRTGSLGLCFGLHAGWVLAAKMTMKIARRAPDVEFPTGAGRRNFLVTRPEAWGSVLLCLLVLWLWYRRRGPQEQGSVE